MGIGWIAEETGAEVVAVAVDVGQGGEDLEQIRKRALACGAVEAVVADARDEFAEQYCLPALQANALYMDRYPLVSALSRPLIVKHLVRRGEAVRRAPPSRTAAPARATTRCASRSASRRSPPTCGDRPGPRLRLDPGEGDPVRRGPRPADRDHASGRRTRSTRTSGAARWRPGSSRTSGTPRSKDVYAYTRNPAPAREPDEVVVRFENGVPVAIDGQPRHDAAGDPGAQRARRRPRRRSARHGRGPARRDQEPRGLRGSRRDRAASPRTRSWRTSPSSATSPGSSAPSASAGRELVYDGLWFSPLKRALDAFVARDPGARHRRDPDELHGGRAVPSPAAARTRRSTTSTSPPTTRATPSTRALAKGFVQLWGLPQQDRGEPRTAREP